MRALHSALCYNRDNCCHLSSPQCRLARPAIVPEVSMTARPTGTVTFLFTAVEGSTQLWEHHHAWMEAAHRRHEAILRAAIAAEGGWAYKMTGDAFQAAFQTAPAALAAAVAAQQALAAEPWGG